MERQLSGSGSSFGTRNSQETKNSFSGKSNVSFISRATTTSKLVGAKTSEAVVPILSLQIRRHVKFYELELQQAQREGSQLLKYFSSNESGYQVKWMECQKYDNGEEYGIPSGFVRLSSGTFKKGFDHQGSIFRASATVNATVDEVMSILMCESTGSLNSAYREICSDFLGGEVLVNVQPRDIINDYKHPQVPLCTIKRLCFSPGSKWSPRDFIVREYCTLDIDNDSGTEMGVITWNHTSLNEVENIKISSCIRGKILEGSGFVVKCCKDASSMSELVFILRVDLGKQKLGLGRSEKKASARIAHMVAGVYAQVESYVERYGSVSQAKGKGFDEAIKLVNTDGEALQAAATISGNAEKIKQRLGAEVIKKETVEIEIEEEIDDDISSEESGSSPRGTPTNLKDIDFEPIDDNDIDMTQAPPSLVLKNASTGAEVRTSKPKWRKAVASIIAGNAVENISRLYRERLKEKEMEKLELEEKLKRLEEETREQLKRLEEQQQKQAEERALIVAAAESTAVARSGNDSRSSSPTGKDEDLETLVENLQKQLENMKVQHEKMKILLKEAHGTTVDFDGTLEDLERKLKEVAVKIQENPDDLMLHKQIEEIDGLIKKHPDYIKRQEEELQNWLEANQPKFQEALKEMRSILPENLAKLGNQEIQAHFKDKDRPRLANHIIKGKGAYIAICRCIHLSTIPKSFDIVELRAFYASLPDEFLADPNGSKRKWKKAILEKLRELTKKEDNNRLTKNEKRNSAYTATSASVSTGTASRGKARGGGPAGFNLAAALQTGRGGLKSSRGRGGPDLAAALQTGRGGLKPSGGRGRGGPDLAAALKAGRGGLKSSRGRGGGIPNLSTLLLGGKSNLKKTPPPPEPSGPGKVNPSPQYPKGVTGMETEKRTEQNETTGELKPSPGSSEITSSKSKSSPENTKSTKKTSNGSESNIENQIEMDTNEPPKDGSENGITTTTNDSESPINKEVASEQKITSVENSSNPDDEEDDITARALAALRAKRAS